MRNGILASIKRTSLAAAACAILFAAPMVKADSFDERSMVTFSDAVELPGGQMLPAGTYVFKLSPIPLARDTVQIFNADENQVIATLFTVPKWLEYSPKESLVTLTEAPSGGAPAVREFMYAGSTRAHEFIYSDADLGR
jgi:hypothetical protein